MTNNGRRGRSGLHEGEGFADPRYDLRFLDPSHRESSYWARFRFRVMTRAADELKRRREMVEFSLLDMVQSWARVVVPAAAAAAAVGALLLSQGQSGIAQLSAGPEETLTQELEDRTLPDFMAVEEEEEGAFLLAGGTY